MVFDWNELIVAIARRQLPWHMQRMHSCTQLTRGLEGHKLQAAVSTRFEHCPGRSRQATSTVLIRAPLGKAW